jgi:hypothetical protein
MPGALFLRGEAIDTRLQFLKDIHQSKVLQDTYLPKRATTVRIADEARKRGRRELRKNEAG